MTQTEFIRLCTLCGYCKKRTATAYAKDRENLSEHDFEEVYRIEQAKQSRLEADRERFKNYQGTKSTKYLKGGTRAENKFGFNHE